MAVHFVKHPNTAKNVPSIGMPRHCVNAITVTTVWIRLAWVNKLIILSLSGWM